jgi:CBS domain-containing protein
MLERTEFLSCQLGQEDAMSVEGILKVKGRTVRTVHSWTTVGEAVSRLSGPPPIGALVVCDDGHRHVAGLITERDIVRGLREFGAQVADRRVSELMSHHVAVCTPRDTLTHLMTEMTRYHQRQLPVVEDGVLCGLVSIGDVVVNRLAEVQLETNVLRDMYLARR